MACVHVLVRVYALLSACARVGTCVCVRVCANARWFFSFLSLQLHTRSGVSQGQSHRRRAPGIRRPTLRFAARRRDLRVRVLHGLSLSQTRAAQPITRDSSQQRVDREPVLFEILIEMPESKARRRDIMAVHRCAAMGEAETRALCSKNNSPYARLCAHQKQKRADMQARACKRAALCIETQACALLRAGVCFPH